MNRSPAGWRFTAVIAVTMLAFPFAAAQAETAQAETAQEVREKMRQAYQEIDTYQSTITSTMEVPGQRQTMPAIEVAFDREAQSLRVNLQGLVTVVQAEQLLARLNGVDDVHLAVQVGAPMTFENLAEDAPFLGQPILADVMLLLGADPLVVTADEHVEPELVETPADQEQPATLQLRQSMPQEQGTLILTIDRETYLVSAVTMRMRHPMDPKQEMVMKGQIEVQQMGEPIDAEIFALDVEDSRAVDSLAALVQAAQPPSPAQALVDKPAPAVELDDLDGERFVLAQAEHEVVILDFWATWCGPCRPVMQTMQQVQAWADEAGNSVQIYAVNIQETPGQIRPYMQRLELTMPVLLDRDGAVARRYMAQAIPQSVIIHNGVVRHVHVGNLPNLEQQLKDEIDALLAEEQE